MPDSIASASQDAWIELAETVRIQLRKAAENIPAMKPGEIKEFVETCQFAQRLELDAQGYDKNLELMMQRFSVND